MSFFRRVFAVGAAGAVLTLAAPASAQFFFKSKDFSGAPVRGDEPGLGQVLPGATEPELRAAMAWNLRAALNVAALQCQFEPTLLTLGNYNAVLTDHKDELKGSFDTLAKYFARTAKTKREGQIALDQFGTRLYSGFATVGAQLNFCQTASSVGRDALYADRGTFSDIARNRIRELRNSLTPYGEQQFTRHIPLDGASYPRLEKQCWKGNGQWNSGKCGPINWPPEAPVTPATVPPAIAAR